MNAPTCCYDDPMDGDGLVWQCRHCRAWRFAAPPPDDDPYLTGQQVAERLGVSRKTVYRWVDEGHLPPPYQWRKSAITALVGTIERPRKGPARNPQSARYTTGRHRIDEVRRPRQKEDA